MPVPREESGRNHRGKPPEVTSVDGPRRQRVVQKAGAAASSPPCRARNSTPTAKQDHVFSPRVFSINPGCDNCGYLICSSKDRSVYSVRIS